MSKLVPGNVRSVAEWIGKRNEPVPRRVRARVFEQHEGRCMKCTRKIVPGEGWICDHILALINGGENRESNLQPLCSWCNKVKTGEDVAVKSKIARIKAAHLGVKAKGRPMPGSKASKFKRKINGTVVLREG